MKNLFLTKIKPHLPNVIGLTGLVVFYAIVGCPARYFLGICCPGCGMTRASLSILKLDFIAAFNYHPLVFIMPVCVVIFFIRKKLPKKLYNALVSFGIVLFIGLYVYRLITDCEYVYIDITRGLIYKIIDFLKTIPGG